MKKYMYSAKGKAFVEKSQNFIPTRRTNNYFEFPNNPVCHGNVTDLQFQTVTTYTITLG